MKKFDSVEKLTDNPHLNLYHMDARKRNGERFDYYFASRNPEEGLKLRTKDLDPEGIVVYAVTEEPEPRLVLIREYRYPWMRKSMRFRPDWWMRERHRGKQLPVR